MTADITAQVREIIADHFELEVSQVTSETKLIDDLGADSLDGVELLMAMEEEFGCEAYEDDVERCRTVDDFVYVIARSMAPVKYMTAGG